MKQVTKFESCDGKLFDSKQECEEHELKLKLAQHLYGIYGRTMEVDDVAEFILEKTVGLSAEVIAKLGSTVVKEEVEQQPIVAATNQNYHTLLDKLKKLHGLAPYNTPSNIVWNDSYFAASIAREYSASDIKKAKRELGV